LLATKIRGGGKEKAAKSRKKHPKGKAKCDLVNKL
tara:strand:+ start:236 stop:340 length:105 start_codon:yes stop_codon:yes gene_type:complete